MLNSVLDTVLHFSRKTYITKLLAEDFELADAHALPVCADDKTPPLSAVL